VTGSKGYRVDSDNKMDGDLLYMTSETACMIFVFVKRRKCSYSLDISDLGL
jgi:hypothetical protein